MSDDPQFVITLSHDKSSEKHVTLAFTLALKGLERGLSTAIILLLDGINVGKNGYAEDIDVGEPFLPVKDSMEVFLSRGGQLMICGSCWKHDHLTDADRLPGTVMINADQVIDYITNAKTVIQLN